MRVLPRVATLGGLLLTGLLVASGCTDTDDSPGTPQSGDSPAPATTKSGETSSPSETPPALTDRLLPTAQVPGLNASWSWQDGETGPAASEPFGFCAKADLASIGATEVVERSYFPPDDSDDSAAQQVAEFPDARTASTAWTVLKAWHDRCGKSADPGIALKIRPLVNVPVTAGSGRWYLLSWQPSGEETGRFEALGMVLNGTRVSVLRIDNSGQDYNYPVGQEPMVGMVTAAADRLD
jgi:hypothetical protein